MEIQAPRGTYDILPPESRKWQYIERVIKETAERFGYSEVRFPIFEHTELFERGVGDTTDIVTKEMYTFIDKGGRSVTLRPEGTASCTRALIEHSIYSGPLPVKWYYNGPMFRYDRPAAGRYRQFHQFGVELFGSNNPYADVEVIQLLVKILENLGLKDYELHLNSVGCPQCRERYREKLVEHITPVKDQLCPDCQSRYAKNPLRVIDCKNPGCLEAIVGFPVLYDSLCDDCRQHYNTVQEGLTGQGIAYLHDNQLVRGLDYYTNTAFEIHLPQFGAASAVGGGGRYNGLVRFCGGPDLPGIGFAIGMERLLSAVERTGIDWEKDDLQVFVLVPDEHNRNIGLEICNILREAGVRTDQDYNGRSMKAQMKQANKRGARLVVIVGEDELAAGQFTIRDMVHKTQLTVPKEALLDRVKEILQ
ncbi:MAG TPA: histidine--tRNA ligase [Syntrophomonadaceae bacterium]|nr:histidine--tRNA ligase [Syntrophomonadaceae bacterium]